MRGGQAGTGGTSTLPPRADVAAGVWAAVGARLQRDVTGGAPRAVPQPSRAAMAGAGGSGEVAPPHGRRAATPAHVADPSQNLPDISGECQTDRTWSPVSKSVPCWPAGDRLGYNGCWPSVGCARQAGVA